MPYRTSRTTPMTPPALPGEWRVYYPYFTPEGVEVTISGRNGLVDDYLHSSDGSWDGVHQSCHSLYADTIRNKARSELVADRIMSHYARGASPNYNPTEKIRGYISHYDIVTSELVFILEKTSTDYQVNIKSNG